MACNHKIEYLVGMADGIHCTKCGAVLDHIPTPEKAEAPDKKAPVKKAPAKKTPAKKVAK